MAGKGNFFSACQKAERWVVAAFCAAVGIVACSGLFNVASEPRPDALPLEEEKLTVGNYIEPLAQGHVSHDTEEIVSAYMAGKTDLTVTHHYNKKDIDAAVQARQREWEFAKSASPLIERGVGVGLALLCGALGALVVRIGRESGDGPGAPGLG